MTTTTPAAILADRCPELATVDRFEILTPELTFELDKAAGGVGASTGRYRLVTHFRLTGGGDEVARFAEEVVFRGPPPNRPSASADDSGALGDPGKPVDLMADGRGGWAALARLVALATGTSYYKVAAPTMISVGLGPITPAEDAFVRALYDHGMREFAVRNDLPVPLIQRWESQLDDQSVPSASLGRIGKDSMVGPDALAADGSGVTPLVPVGGGKDSALVLSVLGTRAVAFTINATAAPRRVAAAAGLKLLTATRRLDPSLRNWNQRGALNGHIPVTAVVTAISALVARAHGCSDVVLGNERSASEPTRWVHGEPVNHQWAKSLEAEDLTQAALHAVTGGRLRTFSILRPFTEVAIASGLVADEAQLGAFLSCNEAFTIWRETSQRTDATWCLNCPKCRFTSLMLAPHVTSDRFEVIFGGRPLHDPRQVDGYRELWDEESKPYECVGEMVESAAAMAELSTRPEWANAAVVQALGAEATRYAEKHQASLVSLMTPTSEHRVPEPYLGWMLDRLDPTRAG